MELTKDSSIMQFEEVYALKLEAGNPVYINYSDGSFLDIPIFEDADREQWLEDAITAFGVQNILISMVVTKKRLVVTDVKFNGNYLAVPQAAVVAAYLKLPFLRHKKIKTNSLRKIRKYSPVELRPLDEFVLETGERLICRYVRKKKETINEISK